MLLINNLKFVIAVILFALRFLDAATGTLFLQLRIVTSSYWIVTGTIACPFSGLTLQCIQVSHFYCISVLKFGLYFTR